ncbi:uncharacterized protein TNCV_408271 [Trichonephila clavipes]|nr:uncharacterized protein TNCV_408271 [Trichonephila clavipes]
MKKGISKKFKSLSINDTLPHIAKPVKQLLKRHLGNDRIISLPFPTVWPSRSPDLSPHHIWLRGYLKNVFSGSIANLSDKKARITQYIHTVPSGKLHSFVYWSHLVVENGGEHIKPVLL